MVIVKATPMHTATSPCVGVYAGGGGVISAGNVCAPRGMAYTQRRGVARFC